MKLLLIAAASLALPSVHAAGGYDMSATFKALKTCSECTAAGYGWCPLRRMCGGFANKECGIGPNYVADSASAKPSKPKKAPSSSKPKAKRAEAKRAEAKPSSGGNDMSSVFAKLRDCSSCTAAGYGWCPNLRKCGGFANKKCGIGERYVSADPPPRNGLWESKKARTERSQSEAPATADVPAAPAPPPATLLYAGPASPPPPSGKVKPTASFEITASGAATSTVASMSASHSASNGTGLLGEEELRQLPHDVLVKRVLDLQNVVESLI